MRAGGKDTWGAVQPVVMRTQTQRKPSAYLQGATPTGRHEGRATVVPPQMECMGACAFPPTWLLWCCCSDDKLPLAPLDMLESARQLRPMCLRRQRG